MRALTIRRTPVRYDSWKHLWVVNDVLELIFGASLSIYLGIIENSNVTDMEI